MRTWVWRYIDVVCLLDGWAALDGCHLLIMILQIGGDVKFFQRCVEVAFCGKYMYKYVYSSNVRSSFEALLFLWMFGFVYVCVHVYVC